MKKIILVRHGETDWNNKSKIQGHTDIPLNEKGKKQAHSVCKHLFENYPEPDIVMSSDLTRCVQTAEHYIELSGKELTKNANFREQNFGKLEGTEFFKYTKDQREKLRKILEDDDFYADKDNEGFEVLPNFRKRILTDFINIVEDEKNENKTMLMFSHGGVIRVIVVYILKMRYNSKKFFTINNTSITTLVGSSIDNCLKLETLNNFSHLSKDLTVTDQPFKFNKNTN